MPLFDERTDEMKELITNEKIETSEPEPEIGGLIVNNGGTTFLIGLHFSETSKDTLPDKVKKLIRKDIESGKF